MNKRANEREHERTNEPTIKGHEEQANHHDITIKQPNEQQANK